MVRLSDLIDLNEDGTKKAFLSHQRHGSLEAPRNILEQPVETSHSFCLGGEDGLCICHMTNDWQETNCYVNEGPMKKLISEELARRPNIRQNGPSVVARLMGVDMLSDDPEPSAMQVEKNKEMKKRNPEKERLRSRSFDNNETRNIDIWSSSLKLNKLKCREHPQEEELQKFKKEFEEWQATRLNECSKNVKLGTDNTDQWLAQQHLNKEKLVHHANLLRKRDSERPEELKRHAVKNQHEICILKLQKNKNEFLAAAESKATSARNLKSNVGFQQLSSNGSSQRSDIASAPMKIVILRPVPDRTGSREESWAISPGISEGGSSIEEFLQEVKERLKCELRGKSFLRTSRGKRTETSYIEKSSEAKKIAQYIARQARESVTRDIGTDLPRPESMRSYRSEIQCEEAGSPEFTYRNTRSILAERLRNVMREEASHDIHEHGRRSTRPAIHNEEKSRAEEIGYTSNRVSHRHDTKDESGMQRKYFRYERGKDVMFDQELFHRTLVRSLSAPVSRTTFGKLLLEDKHVMTGAHIRRKHEASEKVKINVKRWRKEKFNLKEKVSRFKCSFVLRGRIFGRKIKSLEESHRCKESHLKDLPRTPTVEYECYDKQGNSDEVPPSPASICSASNEEFWRQTDFFSPSSTSDVHPLDDSEMPNVFKEISSNLNEIRRQLNQLETYDSDETMIDEQPVEEDQEITEIDNPAEAFIRDLLVASGLYDGSCNKCVSKWDPLGKPISNQVFEEVEESYRQNTNDQEGSTSHHLERLNRKLLCDFLNEVLPCTLGVPFTSSSFTKNTVGPTARPPRGKKLLEYVWNIVRVYVYPPSDMLFQSLENILARDLQSVPWDGLVDEDVTALGKDIENQIISDLVHEMVNEMQL